ncbi:MAG: Sir2 family NAD-dependent protein deacetylase [Aestuariivirga sp.]|uniref:SIR2 family NAD-dependent protein deacylase n=1 Tax=Aestuariivirga sp. TaxID=2650926 RepID=UPI0025C43886|nr:Sir2 family NAD-dependent protein deacetylase [Aestuariivirga sp.]MCA3560698.1 Sir2 family NAD-dependent protein deacetylase [Aestuariivirga sp.]
MVQRARRAVVFTGAGISTECGIPDFRSPGGFWTRFKPIDFSEFLASEDTRLEAWRRFLAIREAIGDVEPGPSHRAVARLAGMGHVSHVITQNIDGLHQASGISAERIIEIHGNATHAKCLSCGLRHEIDWVKDKIVATGRAPRCTACGGIVKSATISFGQAMPEQEMADARAATLNADLFIAIGSSLQVFPAAGFPVLAKQNRSPLVILNREETGLDGLADLVIHADSGPLLGALMGRMGAA